MLLPDGTLIQAESGQYAVRASGNYTFIGFDKAGNMGVETISVEL